VLACADAPECLPITGSCLPGQSGYSEVEAGCVVASAEICTEAGCRPLDVYEEDGVVGWECGDQIGEVRIEMERSR